MVVFTARSAYFGPDRLNISRRAGSALGVHFAPSWELLSWVQVHRSDENAWFAFADAYVREMRISWVRDRRPWQQLLAMERVTLVCECADPQQCHRSLLADILQKLGVEYRGERAMPASRDLVADRKAGWVEHRQWSWVQRRYQGDDVRCTRCNETRHGSATDPEWSTFAAGHAECWPVGVAEVGVG
ncbi:MAG: DUF488 family protein, N3 subclade [Candidatus Xenobia bacterium]